MFSIAERLAMVRREVADIPGDIDVVEFDSLLMDFAEREGAALILRGLRAVADFEYEYQMAGMNQQLNDKIETVFLMADVSLQPIASRLVKEIARYGGAIDKFVPPAVVEGCRQAPWEAPLGLALEDVPGYGEDATSGEWLVMLKALFALPFLAVAPDRGRARDAVAPPAKPVIPAAVTAPVLPPAAVAATSPTA